MGKAAMCIRMLQILNSGRVYKISELADILETNPRNVIEYKKELEEAGYYIISVPGKYGGYRLDKSVTIPTLNLTDEEKMTLIAGASYLEAREDFWDRERFQNVMAKIFSSMNHSDIPMKDTFIIPGVTLAMPTDELIKRYRAMERCIADKRVVTIDFLSNDNVVRRRNIHPYKLFISNNAWFVLGYCELANTVLYFKLNRIMSFSETQKKFRKLLSYEEKNYIDENGLKLGGDWIDNNSDAAKHDWVHIRLKLSGRPAMYVKEYIYGQNQTVTAIDEKTTILECDMQYKYNTIRFVLQFGTDCEVLEPQWLKDEVINICKQVVKEQILGENNG